MYFLHHVQDPALAVRVAAVGEHSQSLDAGVEVAASVAVAATAVASEEGS